MIVDNSYVMYSCAESPHILSWWSCSYTRPTCRP